MEKTIVKFYKVILVICVIILALSTWLVFSDGWADGMATWEIVGVKVISGALAACHIYILNLVRRAYAKNR